MNDDHRYELFGYLVYETKFGGHWNFHPKDELPAGEFLKHREHTPVYARAAGVPGTFLPCSFCKTADACKVSGCVDAKIGRAIAAGERAAAGVPVDRDQTTTPTPTDGGKA